MAKVSAKVNMKKKRMNRYERANYQVEKLAYHLHGNGLYEFRNNTSGDLMLAKMPTSGSRNVPRGKTWIGDDYFMYMVKKTNEATLVRTIETPIEENAMSQEKLILDQPDKVTTEGKVEQVVKKLDKAIKLNEVQPQAEEAQQDILLTDSPIDGVEIC